MLLLVFFSSICSFFIVITWNINSISVTCKIYTIATIYNGLIRGKYMFSLVFLSDSNKQKHIVSLRNGYRFFPLVTSVKFKRKVCYSNAKLFIMIYHIVIFFLLSKCSYLKIQVWNVYVNAFPLLSMVIDLMPYN